MLRFFNFTILLILATTWTVAQSKKEIALLFELGENELNKGRYTEAIPIFSKVIASQVDHIDAYYYRGVAKENCNDFAGALLDYNLALEWKNDFAEALLRSARLYFRMERYDDAQRDFKRLLTIPQGETHDIIYRKSSYEQGINRIITAQGATDIIFNYLGLISIRKQQYHEAIIWLDSAINLFNGDADYYVNRGTAREKLRQYDAAKTDFEMALKKSPDHALAQQHLSALARIQGNIDESDRYLSEAIERNPHLPYAYLERAYYRNEVGDYGGAIEDYTAALRIDSLDAEVWVNRGLIFEKAKQLNAAYHDFTRAIKLDETLANAWLCRANILVKQNKLVEAIDDYGIAIYSDPEYALAYYNRALTHYRMGNNQAACEDLKKAEDLGRIVPTEVKNKVCHRESY